jgi:hypothetical protein
VCFESLPTDSVVLMIGELLLVRLLVVFCVHLAIFSSVFFVVIVAGAVV